MRRLELSKLSKRPVMTGMGRVPNPESSGLAVLSEKVYSLVIR